MANQNLQYPIEFVSNITDIFGEQGSEWLKQIPNQVLELEKKWQFNLDQMLPNLTYSYVASVTLSKGRDGILKLAPSCSRTNAENAWYQCNQKGTPQVYNSDPTMGAILMQRLVPGSSLKKKVQLGADDEATLQLAKAIRNLQPGPHSDYEFKHVAILADDLSELEGKIDSDLIDRAKSIFKEFTYDRSNDYPLHGDIHHDNILLNENDWLVIDPHGYMGPRSFEVGAMLRNPYDCFPSGDQKRIIHRRLSILLSELSFQKEEILAWSYAYTLLAAAWSVSDHHEVPKEHLEIAKLVLEFKP